MRTPDHDKMPHWARRIDEMGPRRWQRQKEYRSQRAEFISAIVFTLIALVVLYKLPDWHLKFVTEKYGAVMFILIFSCLVQIGGNLLMLLFAFRPVAYLARIFMEAASFLAQITFYYLYPLDFSNTPGLGWIDIVLPWILIIGMVISAIKVLSNIWKLIFWR
ncbi:MAG: hypothetical protein WCK92_08745 [Bacteroidota bacterium]